MYLNESVITQIYMTSYHVSFQSDIPRIYKIRFELLNGYIL